LAEHGGFEALGAREVPAGLGHLLDQERFVLVGGFEVIAKAGEEDIELFLILVGEDGEGSGESVLGGVPRGGGFALLGFRPGREGRVLLIGCDLSYCSHVIVPA
jgi:hypothetical protein